MNNKECFSRQLRGCYAIWYQVPCGKAPQSVACDRDKASLAVSGALRKAYSTRGITDRGLYTDRGLDAEALRL